MTYDEWEATVPAEIKADLVWRVQAYRLGSYLAACADHDSRALATDARLVATAAQLFKAAGSVPANIAEGYSRLSTRDRVRYYEYALGSAAEARTWYVAMRDTLGAGPLAERVATLRSITRLLLTMIRSGRATKTNATPADVPNR